MAGFVQAPVTADIGSILQKRLFSSKINFTVYNDCTDRDESFDGIDTTNDDVLKVIGMPHNVLMFKNLLNESDQISLIELSHSYYSSKQLTYTTWTSTTYSLDLL